MAHEETDLSAIHLRQLRDEKPWIWLYEIEVPTEPPTRYRLTNYTQEVSFGTNSAGEPIIYKPCPIGHSDITQTLEGDLPQFQLQVGHAGREMAATLEAYIGLVDSPVRVYVVNSEDLASAAAAQTFEAEVTGCRVTNDKVTLAIGSKNLSEAIVPPLRFQRHHCGHEYGGTACAFDLSNGTLAAGFPTCPKSYEACTDRGIAEVGQGYAKKHPQRFGGWRSIPRGKQ
jgi:phage-related protein